MKTHSLIVKTQGRGLYEITDRISRTVYAERLSEDGLVTLFIQHTSASLIIQENADPSARRDLETWIDRFVPEGDPQYTHTTEGPDDMPAHIRSVLTATSLSVPLVAGRLGLGTWQGIYLWEHRRHGYSRRVLVNICAG